MMDVFPRIYKKESRFVIVLYREEWGSGGWTKREYLAIQDRVLKEGEEFLLFIRLDDSKLPEWLSAKYAYHSFKPSELDSLIMTVESRLNSVGSKITYETPIQRAKAIKIYQEILNKKREFLASNDGYKSRSSEIEKFIAYLKSIKEQIPQPTGFTEDRLFYEIRINLFSLSFNFQNEDISIQLVKRSFHSESHYERIFENIYLFDCDFNLIPGWTNQKTKEFLYTENLADTSVHKLLDKIDPR